MALDLTTLARVRRATGFGDDDKEQDPLLSVLITTVSKEMEGELRRKTKQQVHTEILPLWYPAKILTLSGTPILDTPAPVVMVANDRDFVTSPTTLVRGQDYILENDTGILRFLLELYGWTNSIGRSVAPTYVQATYTGGCAASTAEFITNYPHLASAADLQVSYLYKRKDTPGGNMVVGPNNTSFNGSYDWLPSVRRVLELEKRRGVY